MNRSGFISCLLFFFCISLASASSVLADTARTMPKGLYRIELQNKFWFPITERYDTEGDKKDLGAAFSMPLNSSGFSALGAVEEAAGMTPGSGSLGTTDIDLTMHYNDLILYYQYGLTDKLTIGAEIPYYWQWTDVKRATVNTRDATIGINPTGNGPPLLPLTQGGVANGDLAMEMLQGQLQGMGYQRLADWSDQGFGDILAGARYQYFEQPSWRLAVTGGLTFPTGKMDDADNLTDIEFGRGAWGFFVHSNNDYTGIPDLTINLTFRYDHYLTNSQDRHIPSAAGVFLSGEKEDVDVQLGDKVEAEISAIYYFTDALSAECLYRYAYQGDDSISGHSNRDYSMLAEDSSREEHVGRTSLSCSTLAAFRQGTFFLPLVTSIEYRDRFAGSNLSVSRYIRFKVALFF